MQKLLTFFSKKIQHICISLDVNFNKLLTNDIVSFEQLGPDRLRVSIFRIHITPSQIRLVYVDIMKLKQHAPTSLYFPNLGIIKTRPAFQTLPLPKTPPPTTKVLLEIGIIKIVSMMHPLKYEKDLPGGSRHIRQPEKTDMPMTIMLQLI